MDYKENIVYRYLNLNGEIIYVGKTGNLKKRFNQHKSEDMYKECYKVEYIELGNPADIEIYETYYINKYKPKYNSAKVYDCEPSFLFQNKNGRYITSIEKMIQDILLKLRDMRKFLKT